MPRKRTTDEPPNSVNAKRLKEDEQTTGYLRNRLIALQEENKTIKNKLEEMETTWMREYHSPRLSSIIALQ